MERWGTSMLGFLGEIVDIPGFNPSPYWPSEIIQTAQVLSHMKILKSVSFAL